MYSKHELAKQREEFWTTFGRYMAPLPAAGGEKVNWVNYKTGKPGIAFKMQADTNGGTIGIYINTTDTDQRQAYYNQFLQLKKVLEDTLGEVWAWTPDMQDQYGKPLCTIETGLPGASIMKKEDWPGLISFFKPRIVGLDEFWDSAKYAFNPMHSHP